MKSSESEWLRKELLQLSDAAFLDLFRSLLDEKAYPYPDRHILAERENAILVLLADVAVREVETHLRRVKEKYG